MSYIDQSNMKRFPTIELSYGQIDHTKVPFDAFTLIPCGKKFYAWFTYEKGECVCFIVDAKSKIIIEKCTSIFDSTLSFNTILYGTLVNYDKNRFFVVEDLCYYKNKNTIAMRNGDKYKQLEYMFQYELQMTPFFSNMITFGMPVVKKTLNEAIETSQMLTYNIYAIQCSQFKNNRRYNKVIYNKNNKDEVINATLKIVPQIQCDMYEVFGYSDGKIVSLGNASVPSYNTSVMLNKLFRNIKENANLDALEESDDEDEFENICDDKFVDLEKTYNMECVYNKRTHKWIPKKVVNTSNLTNVKHLTYNLNKKFKNKKY